MTSTKAAMMMLAMVASLVSYGVADPTQRKYELGFPCIGTSEALKGGALQHRILREYESYDAKELWSLMRLAKEGYTPYKTEVQRTKVWTYNCQLANESRIRQWSEEFRDAYVLVHGTQRRYEASRGEKAHGV